MPTESVILLTQTTTAYVTDQVVVNQGGVVKQQPLSQILDLVPAPVIPPSELSELADVTISSPLSGQILTYESGQWTNANPPSSGGGGDTTILLGSGVPSSGLATSNGLIYEDTLNSTLYISKVTGGAPTLTSLQIAHANIANVWPLSETGGTTAVAAYGGVNGEYQGFTVSANSVASLNADQVHAISFNGTSAYVTLGSINDINLGGDWSVEFVCSTSNTDWSKCGAIGNFSSTGFVVQVDNDTQRFGINDYVDISNTLNAGANHIVCTYANSTHTLKIYLNSVLKRTSTGTYASGDAGGLFIAFDGNNFYEGSIQNVALYKAVLNSTDISNHYTSAINTVGPTAEWIEIGSNATLASDTDVHITSPVNNQVLTYSESISAWINSTPASASSGGSSTLAADTDVEITSPENGQALTYSSSISAWINSTLASGGGSSTLAGLSDIDNATEAYGLVLAAIPSAGKAFSWTSPISGGGGGGSTIPIGTPTVNPYAVQLFANFVPTNQIPAMTDATTPSGLASASSYYSGVDPYNAFNSSLVGWITDGSTLPQWIQYEFTSPKTITSYQIKPWSTDNFPGRSPSAWILEASNDGSTWTTIDTQVGFSAWTINTLSTPFYVTNATAYQYWRLSISANLGNTYTGIGQLALNTFGTSGTVQLCYMDMTGATFALTSNPI